MIALYIILYILIGCIVGSVVYIFLTNYEEVEAMFAGIFWPLALLLLIGYYSIEWICNKICNVLEYFKNEGFHYYKEDIEPCCGQCKHIRYWNNHNEMNKCPKREGTSFSSNHIPCEYFRKSLFWRFRIRIGWDKKK